MCILLKDTIISTIKEILDEQYGFEIYIVMKSGDKLIKRFILDEGNPNEPDGFKNRIRNSIQAAIRNNYMSDECKYADSEDLADENSCIYVIEQNEEYHPFKFIDMSEEKIDNFKLSDKNNADAVLFKFTIQRNGTLKRLWAYQKIIPSSIPNKKNQHFQLITKSDEHTDIFRELEDQMFIITRKVDLLILNNEIITGNVGLMERHFGLETFIRASAAKAATEIEQIGLIENNDRLQEFVQRPDKKYARKMMQIHKFPVTTMNKDELLNKLNTVERWKNVFDIRGTGIHLRNYTDVEKLIDLFTERYTRSDVSGQEYDTSVKNVIEPVNNENITS